MKLLFSLLILLVIASLASALCGPSFCRKNQIAFEENNDYCRCIHQTDNTYVTLDTRKINQWEDGTRDGKTFSQFEVVINNIYSSNLKDIFIGTYSSFKLRDESSESLWNMEIVHKGLILPAFQEEIVAHQSFTFGFIVEGTELPKLKILALEY